MSAPHWLSQRDGFEFAFFVSLDVGHGSFVVVSKDQEPVVGNGFRVEALAAFYGVERVQVEGHGPGGFEVGGGRDEISGEAGGFAAALDEDGLHVGGVPAVDARFYAWKDF